MLIVSILSNQSVQIDVHVLKNKVNVLVILGFDDIVEPDDVFMLQLFEEHDLTISSLSVR